MNILEDLIRLSKKTVVTKNELFRLYAPNFNFEKDESQILKLALKRGFVTKIGNDQYKINNQYEGEKS